MKTILKDLGCSTGRWPESLEIGQINDQQTKETRETTFDNNNEGQNGTDKSKINLSKAFQIQWRNLSFRVTDGSLWSHSKRNIFHNLNGHIRSGEISAILGPSGAGKTSLLNAITGFAPAANYSGSIKVISSDTEPLITVHIPQKDKLIDCLTARENIVFASRIKNAAIGAKTTVEQHKIQATTLASILNLDSCLDTCAAHLSGGEYKRVSIAQELTSRANILVLDEPTSGLDSLNCKRLIEAMQNLIGLSRRGLIEPLSILMTIHQPPLDVFYAFDRLYVMAITGDVIYSGTSGNELLERVQSALTLHGLCHDDEAVTLNPASYLIELASGEYGNRFIDALTIENKLRDDSSLIIDREITKSNGIDHLNRDQRLSTTAAAKHNKRSFVNIGQWLHLVSALAQRNIKLIIRDLHYLMAAWAFHLLVPFVMRGLFSPEVGKANACPILRNEYSVTELFQGQNDRVGGSSSIVNEQQIELENVIESATLFLMLLASVSLNAAALTGAQASVTMALTMKELRNGWYSVWTLVMANTLSSFLLEMLLPMIMSLLSYWLMGHPHSPYAWRSLLIAFIMGLVALVSHGQAFVFGSVFSASPEAALMASVSSMLPLILYNGLTGSLHYCSYLVKSLSWLSMHRLATAVVMSARYGFGMCTSQCNLTSIVSTNVEPQMIDAPRFVDIPSQFESLTRYWLSESIALASNLSQPVSDLVNNKLIVVNVTQRASMINPMTSDHSNDSSVFDGMAQLMSKSLAYGQSVPVTCRSHIMHHRFGPDHWISYEIVALFALLVFWKLCSCFVLHYRRVYC